MNNYKKHQDLLKNVKLALQKKYPAMRIFDRHVGFFKTFRGTPIRINKPGMADLWAMYQGKHYEFEIKTGKATQTKEQKDWQKTVTACGSEYYVIRSIEEIEHLPI